MSRTARLANAMGESGNDALRVDFDANVKLEFHGSKVTSDAGLLPYRELHEALVLTAKAGCLLHDCRTGKNTRHTMTALLRQSVFSRLAGPSSNAFGGSGRGNRCRDDGSPRRNGGKTWGRRNGFARIGNGRPYAGRFGQRHGLATAGYPLHRAERMLADLAIGDRLVRKADGGRRPKAIREIPVE